MFQGPKKSKYKKVRKGSLGKFKYNSNKLYFGIIGLKARNSGILNARQIESARRAIVRKTKRKSKLWIRIFPDLPITKKPTGVRMGKGKGPFSHWGARITGGTTIFELAGANIKQLIIALKSCAHKLPIKTVIFNQLAFTKKT